MAIVLDGNLGITSPAETVQGALTTTGNTILGDASTDTLNVGNGGLVKDASGNVGIGIDSPATVLHTYSINAGTPTTSGSATTGVSARFQNSSVNLDVGTYSSGECFIQPRLLGNNATNFGLTLNPNGGNVSINNNLLFNSGYGSAATAYGCRAWVNFDGTGTVAIRASGNVSSITDNGTGDYTVNFSTAMTDANYAASAIAQRNATGLANQSGLTFIPANGTTVRQTSSAFRVMTTDQGMIVQDAIVMTVMIVR